MPFLWKIFQALIPLWKPVIVYTDFPLKVRQYLLAWTHIRFTSMVTHDVNMTRMTGAALLHVAQGARQKLVAVG